MFTVLKKYKGVLITLVVIVIGFMLYTTFFVGRESGENGVTETPVAASQHSDLVALLLTLRSIDLDANIFESTAFKSLRDFGQPLRPEATGRENPFAPIGR